MLQRAVIAQPCMFFGIVEDIRWDVFRTKPFGVVDRVQHTEILTISAYAEFFKKSTGFCVQGSYILPAGKNRQRYKGQPPVPFGVIGDQSQSEQVTKEEWEQVMKINVDGVFLCTKYVIPYMKENGGGSIINLSSIYGLIGNKDLPPYHASKGAVRLMTKNDALTYAEENIRINSVHPGF